MTSNSWTIFQLSTKFGRPGSVTWGWPTGGGRACALRRGVPDRTGTAMTIDVWMQHPTRRRTLKSGHVLPGHTGDHVAKNRQKFAASPELDRLPIVILLTPPLKQGTIGSCQTPRTQKLTNRDGVVSSVMAVVGPLRRVHRRGRLASSRDPRFGGARSMA